MAKRRTKNNEALYGKSVKILAGKPVNDIFLRFCCHHSYPHFTTVTMSKKTPNTIKKDFNTYFSTGKRSKTSCPSEGWPTELSNAEAAAKKCRSAAAFLRVAVAARTMRLWKKSIVNAQLGLAMNPKNEEEKQELEDCARIGNAELKERSFLEDPGYEELRKEITCEDLNIETAYISDKDCMHSNLNAVQYAAMMGDVRLLEELVALGAALDSPPLPDTRKHHQGCSVPLEATALLLVCTMLALNKKIGIDHRDMRKMSKLHVECAIVLIKLGANVSSTTTLKWRKGKDPESMNSIYRGHGLHGKTVKQLINMIGDKDLLQASLDMSTPESSVENAYCRCGSRLPWVECHAGEGYTPFAEVHNKTLSFRFSPLAPCYCKLTTKTYFKCCWNSINPRFQEDATGMLVGTRKHKKTGENDMLMKSIVEEACRADQESTTKEGNQDAYLFPARDENGRSLNRPRTAEEMQASMVKHIQYLGLQPYLDHDPIIRDKTTMHDWDKEVCAGCVSRLDDAFLWWDVHWKFPKAELLQRTKEWNEALQKYCNDMGLTGSERAEIVDKHTAIPLAICGNPTCDKFETKVKEFRNCSRCKSVGYCSRQCQSDDWKNHKNRCCRR